MSKSSSKFALSLFVLLVVPAIALAQFPGDPSENWKKPVTVFLGDVGTLGPEQLKTAVKKPRPKRRPANRNTSTPARVLSQPSLFFTPVAGLGVDRELVNSLTANPNERVALLTLLRETKKAYDVEVAKVGRSNNVAAAFTFFIATCVTAYNDAPEPSDEATENLMDALSELMSNIPQITQLSNRDKQALHDRMVYISGLILAGYINGKQSNDQASLQAFRLLAGICLQSVLQLEPQRLHFNETGLVIE